MMFLLLVLSIYAILGKSWGGMVLYRLSDEIDSGVATLELSGRYTMEQLTGNDIRYRLLVSIPSCTPVHKLHTLLIQQRNADKTARRWTNAEVPYVFDSGLRK